MKKQCLVSMNLELFKVLNGGSEVDCGMPALRDEDFCLYHWARDAVDKVEKAEKWEFRVQIEEPVSLELGR